MYINVETFKWLVPNEKNWFNQIAAFLPRSLQASEQSSAEWLYNVFAPWPSLDRHLF